MSSPWFFLSYARSDGDVYFKRFRQELAEAVRVKVGGPLEAVAFVDRDSIAVGQEWPEALTSALQTSRVLVPVYSRSYFASEYCGKEWAVFRQRQEAALAAAGGAGGARPPVILPVLWVGKEDLPLPLPMVARDLQFDHGAFGDQYAGVGLRYLMLQSRHLSNRRQMIAALADRIVAAANQHTLPPLASQPMIVDVPNAFRDDPAGIEETVDLLPRPPGRYVQFIFVAGTQAELKALREQVECYGTHGAEEWQPFHPDVALAVADVALEVAGAERLWPERVSLGGDLIQRLEQAESENKVVAIIVDTWTLQLQQYHNVMREYDKRLFPNSVVLIPWNQKDSETAKELNRLKTIVKGTFLNRLLVRDTQTFMDEICSAEDLRKSLSTSLAAARARIIRAAEVRKSLAAEPVAKPIISVRPGG